MTSRITSTNCESCGATLGSNPLFEKVDTVWCFECAKENLKDAEIINLFPKDMLPVACDCCARKNMKGRVYMFGICCFECEEKECPIGDFDDLDNGIFKIEKCLITANERAIPDEAWYK